MSGTWQAIGEITVDWMANWETMGWEEHIEAEPLRQTTCFPTSTRWPNREARLSGCLQRGIPATGLTPFILRVWPAEREQNAVDQLV